MKLVFSLVLQFVGNVWGSMQTPYATYRKIVGENPYQLFFVFFLVGLYFFFISPLKLHTLHPFLLTLNTTRLFSTVMATFFLICLSLYTLGHLVGGKGRLRAVFTAWGYSLSPTLVWFLATSLFYIVLPPPRQQTIAGIAFSLLFITFSLSLFLWKGILYYLTLRFAMQLDMKQIIVVSVIFLPSLVVYSLVLYYLGIFKVPFV